MGLKEFRARDLFYFCLQAERSQETIDPSFPQAT